MRKTKHTPGPWKVQEGISGTGFKGWWIKQDDDVEFPITFITDTIGGTNPPQEANTKLISAAPDMLEACQEIGAYEIGDCPDCDGTGKNSIGDACRDCGGAGEVVKWTCLPEDVRRCRESVAKAEGKEKT